MNIEKLIHQNALNGNAPFRVEVCNITPALAKELLDLNTANRNPKVGHINTLVAEIKSGRWNPNGSTIVIGSDGVIKDGQHRLLAVVKAGIPIVSAVAYGLSNEVWKTIDTGKTRTASDIFKLNGVANSISVSAIVSQVLRIRVGWTVRSNNTTANAKGITNAEVYEEYMTNQDGYQIVFKLSAIIYKQQNYGLAFPQSIVGAVLYLAECNEDTAMLFADSISGKNGNTYASELYKKAVNEKSKGRSLSHGMLLIGIIKAWNNFVNGDPQVGRLVFPKELAEVAYASDRIIFE